MFDGLYFEYPKVFSFIVIFIACDAYCRLRTQGVYFPHVTRLEQEKSGMSHVILLLKWLGVVLMILALMSPVRDEVVTLAPQQELSTMLVLDNSAGMQEHFDESSALAVAKAGLLHYIETQREQEVGLLLSNEQPYIASALTTEHPLLKLILAQVKAEGQKSDLEVTFAQLVTHLGYKEEGKRIALLISNRKPEVSPLTEELLQYLREKKIIIYRLFLGLKGERESASKHDIRSYFAEDKKGVFDAIDTIVKLESVQQYDYTFKKYYYIYPLFFAFFTFLIYIYLRNRRVT